VDQGSLAIDVRITDVESGLIVDAVNVRKQMNSSESKGSGVASAIGNSLTRGRLGNALQAAGATDEVSSARKDSVDRVLREAIEEAIHELSKRLDLR
jgi:curli biogenesis system outer membrane secretion channel CsgG